LDQKKLKDEKIRHPLSFFRFEESWCLDSDVVNTLLKGSGINNCHKIGSYYCMFYFNLYFYFNHLRAVHIEPPVADEVDLVEEGAVGAEEAVLAQGASPIPALTNSR
jgi:hypothetical protein